MEIYVLQNGIWVRNQNYDLIKPGQIPAQIMELIKGKDSVLVKSLEQPDWDNCRLFGYQACVKLVREQTFQQF